jgi:LacI family transcriptional regulator
MPWSKVKSTGVRSLATTIVDVAREADVSIATVSRVLTGKSAVRNERRERVLDAAERLGYRPNALARSLREETTKTLALVLPNIANSFFTTIARVIEQNIREKGYSLILGSADEDPKKEEFYLNVLLEKRVDGIIVSPSQVGSPHLTKLSSMNVPLVLLDRDTEEINAPHVRADGREAIQQLVSYLIELGHEQLAIISGPLTISSGKERLTTFLQSAKDSRVPVPNQYVKIGDFRRRSGLKAMRELLALSKPPTAVFVANNLMTLGALQAIKAVGSKVPEDISLASFDDVAWFEFLDPPLTAIAQPTEELGSAAARMLLEMAEGGKRPKSLIMQAELLIRNSCEKPRGNVKCIGSNPRP